MDDGQVLTALAKNVKNLKVFNPKKDMEVTHWYLNKQEATRAIYHNGDREIDEATTVARLKTLIEGFHRKFISGNPDESLSWQAEANKLKAEIDAMTIDLSDVVFVGNQKENDQEPTMPAQPMQNMTEEETDRLIRSFKEIVDFTSKNNREPQETKENIEERKLWARLNGIREDEDKKAILKQYDTLGLLEGTFKPQVQEEAKEQAISLQDKLEVIKGFIGVSQYSILKNAIKSDENEFEEVIERLHQTITTMPKTYEQDGKGNKAVAYLHYFKGGSDWYITEKDTEDEQLQAFGLVSLNGDYPEIGYISIEELKKLNIELDFYWEPKTIGEIKKDLVDEDDEDEGADEEFETVKEKAKAKQLDIEKEVDDTYTVSKVENIALSVVIGSFSTLSEAEDFIDNYGEEKEQPKMEIKDEETATPAPTDYSKYKGALSRIIAASIETIEEVETDIEIIENAYNANPDDEELKNIYQQVLNKLDEMAGI